MPVENTVDRVFLKHPKGASVEILLYGATVLSWKTNGNEHLFVSSKAALDGSKPVRGGIPVVFPCFGAPTHEDHAKLGQHGFARSETWTYGGVVMDNEAGVSVRLLLEPTPEITAVYDKEFYLAYVVTLSESQLSTDLHVTNASSSAPLIFQALFHTYIRAPSDAVTITPLKDLSYYDKTETTEAARAAAKIETREAVDVKKFTDSVYSDAGGKYAVSWPNGSMHIRANNLKDVVVWNPQAEAGAKIVDMEENGWEKYVCVEPGYVRGFVSLEPGHKWIGQQVLYV